MEKHLTDQVIKEAVEELYQTPKLILNRRKKKDRRAINTCIEPKFERRFYTRRRKTKQR